MSGAIVKLTVKLTVKLMLFCLVCPGEKTGQNPLFVYIIQDAFPPRVESNKEIG